MKTTIQVVAALGATATLALTGFVAQAAGGINMPDAALKTCVNTSLGQAADADISAAQAAQVTFLECFDRGIVDLTGMEAFTNMVYLDLAGNQISDLTPVGNLAALDTLKVPENQISSLAPLSGNTVLRELHAAFNQISDVSPAAKLTNLTLLDVGQNQISDISSLAPLTKVTNFNIDYNQVHDVSVLAQMTSVTEFWANGNQITDLSALGDRAMSTMRAQSQQWELPEATAGTPYQFAVLDGAGQLVPLEVLSAGGTGATVADDQLNYTGAGTASYAFQYTNSLGAVFSGNITQPVKAAPATGPTTEPTGEPTTEPTTEPTSEPTTEPTTTTTTTTKVITKPLAVTGAGAGLSALMTMLLLGTIGTALMHSRRRAEG